MRYDNYTKAERTRQFIIEKAAPVFNRQGYAATSMADIVAATGLTKGAIYGNFKNKDEVAVAAFEYNLGFVVKAIAEQMKKAESSVDKLLAYPGAYRAIRKSMLANGGCPVLNTSVDSCEVNVTLQQIVSKTIYTWRRGLTEIIDEGRLSGEFTDNTDSTNIAEILICLVEGGYAMTKATGEMSFLDSAITQMEKMIKAL